MKATEAGIGYRCESWLFFSSRRRHTRCLSDWSSDVCSSDLLSTIAGTAFVDFGAAGLLTPSLGNQLTITDSGGKHLVGYIKAAGATETYSAEMLPNSTFENTTNVGSANATLLTVNSGCQSGGSTGCLKITATAGNGAAYESTGATSGMLLHSSVYLEKGTETNALWFNILDSGWSVLGPNPTSGYVLPATWTQYSAYTTAPVANSNVIEAYTTNTSGDTALVDTAS